MFEAKTSTSNFLEVKKAKYSGLLEHFDQDQKLVSTPVQISIRGFTSALNCAFPKLEIKLDKSAAPFFGGLKKVDLNTHCDDSKNKNSDDYFIRSMTFNHRELIAYRIQEILNLPFLQTKKATLSYIDSDTGLPPAAAPAAEYPAFFVEDVSEYRKRMLFTEVKSVNDVFKNYDLHNGKSTLDQYKFTSFTQDLAKFDLLESAKVEIFQNLIMNGDWYFKLDSATSRDSRENGSAQAEKEAGLWNIKLFESSTDSSWKILAQDFNFTLLVLTPDILEQNVTPPVTRRFTSLLNIQQLDSLMSLLSAKKTEIVSAVDIVQGDPKFNLIQETLRLRYEKVYSDLLELKTSKEKLIP
jgi:hypothetical protein